jgi:hypothetical protein
MVRTGLFLNEDGNVFSACMTCEEELGRLLGGRKNEPLVPPAFITSAVLKRFRCPTRQCLGCEQKHGFFARAIKWHCPASALRSVSRRRGYAGRHGSRAPPAARASKPREAGNAWTFYPLPFYTARIRDAPGSDAARIK